MNDYLNIICLFAGWIVVGILVNIILFTISTRSLDSIKSSDDMELAMVWAIAFPMTVCMFVICELIKFLRSFKE